MNHPWDPSTFENRLREVGARAYHDKHPFHEKMNEGKLSREAVTGWVVNRFYYQQSIPRKDAAIMANMPSREVRRLWLHRITDHDGIPGGDDGGIESWLRLGEACGVSREALLDPLNVEPGVRSSVDAYVAFARTQPWPVAVASSLTEMFVPNLMAKRLDAFERHYRWIDPAGLDYFRRRLVQAPRDSSEGLRLTLEHCNTRELQLAAVGALSFKCNLLWALLDAIAMRYEN
ncbi:MAG TPA: pyrroloquinoline-quinone synthase PqqC [Chthoniobacteraceae bacterium]|jgi:pyrroloquinoline-quinone synthase|nr:pyrroloquinoline-quinone synthase PqqC [Chthoniobacteraceae bacterium]